MIEKKRELVTWRSLTLTLTHIHINLHQTDDLLCDPEQFQSANSQREIDASTWLLRLCNTDEICNTFISGYLSLIDNVQLKDETFQHDLNLCPNGENKSD